MGPEGARISLCEDVSGTHGIGVLNECDFNVVAKKTSEVNLS